MLGDESAAKPTLASDSSWPAPGAQLLDFNAALPTTSMYRLRLLCRRLFEKSNDSYQSELAT